MRKLRWRSGRQRLIVVGLTFVVVFAGGWTLDPLVGAGVLVAAAVWRLVTTTRCDPVTLLSIYLMMLVLIPARFIFGPLGAVGTPGVLVGLVAAGWWCVSRLMPSLATSVPGVQPVRTTILGFAWVMVLTYGFAFTRALTSIESGGADRAIIALAALCGTTLLACDGIESHEQLERLLRRLVIAAVILAAFGILQFTTGVDPAQLLRLPGLGQSGELRSIQEGGAVRRVASTALHPIEFGVVLILALPFALHYAFHAPAVRRKREWAKVMIIGVAVPMSVSRSAVLGVVVVMLFLMRGWSWRRRFNIGASVMMLLAGMHAVIPGLLGTIKSLILNAGSDPSVQGRTDDYGPLFALWRKTPWLGRGLGTFDPGENRYLDNQYLGSLIDTGVIGLAALIVLLLVVMGCARGARRRSSDTQTRDLASAMLASIAAAAVTFATFDALAFPMNAGVLFLLFGCVGTLWRLVFQAQQAERGAARARTGERLAQT